MKILFKIASRERPKWLIRLLKNIEEKISPDREYEILLSIDRGDESFNEVKPYLHFFKNINLQYGDRDGKIGAINRHIDRAKIDWDVVMVASDDMLFTYNDWDKDMELLIKGGFKDNNFFAHFSDGHTFEAIPSMSIIGRDAYEMDKYIYNPIYKSLWCDNEAKEVAIRRGHYKYFDLVFFSHVHPANFGIPQDDLYKHNESFYLSDQETYNQRAALNFGFPL